MPYLEKILIANKRSARYYNLVKKRGTNVIPPSYHKKIGTKYNLDINGYLIDNITKEKVVSNPRTVGKKHYWVINFQGLYSQQVYPATRAIYMDDIKNHIKPYLKGITKVTKFPLKIELTIFCKEMKVDIDNKSVIFVKCFQDLLTKSGLIPDDSIKYITNVEYKWIESDREEMEFKIIEL